MKIVGVRDFNAKDLYAPEGKRTQRNLSALINFLRFKYEKSERFEMLKKESVSSYSFAL